MATILAPCSIIFGQTFLEDYARVKQIRLLESEAADVIKLLASDSLNIGIAPIGSRFYRNDSVINVSYTSGECVDDPDTDSLSATDWNAAGGQVAVIRLGPKDTLLLKDLGIDLKTFRKERFYRSHKNFVVFHNKQLGMAIAVHGDAVDQIVLFPGAAFHYVLCPNARKYYAGSKWRRYPEHKQNVVDFNFPAHVLKLDVSPITDNPGAFRIQTKAEDPENDVLTYNYYVSAGKITGRGANVIWDLTDVPAGAYEITATVDDGCGICGKYITKSITIP